MADKALVSSACPPLTSQETGSGKEEDRNAAVPAIDAVSGSISTHRTECARAVRARARPFDPCRGIGGIIEAVTDPYLDGIYRWWHLSIPSPELGEAEADGWLGEAGTAVDLGCGTEIAYLAARGWHAVGIDLSRAALDRARHEHPDVPFVQADVLSLPFPSGAFRLVLDRGCFHYLSPAPRTDYAAEARRIPRPDGRLPLRACLTSRGVRNDVT